MKLQIIPSIAAFLATTILIAGVTVSDAQAQSMEASSQLVTIPAGTLAKVQLQRALDSTTMVVGDKVRVNIAPDDTSGLPKDCILVGRVTEASPATKNTPGVIDITFGALERAGNPWKTISVDLALGNYPQVNQTANVSVTGQTTQDPNTKIIGYGAGGGAVLGSLLKHNSRSFIRGGVLGMIGGAIAAETTKKKTGTPTYFDVKVPVGTELTVTLNQPITVQSTIVITTPPTFPDNTDPNLGKLLNVMLQPTELMGNPVPDYPGTRKLYVRLTNAGQVQGFAGVNTFSGTFTVGGTYKFAGTDTTDVAYPLSFSPLAATKIAGPGATMALESKFLTVLGTTMGYRPEGKNVAFLAGNKVIARFKRIEGK